MTPPGTNGTPSELSELLTVAEAAAKMRVSDETVHRWCRDGIMAYVALPSGTKRFRRDEVERILSGQTRGRV